MVLLVVDTQKAITNSRLYQFDVFESHVRELINKARYNNQHCSYKILLKNRITEHSPL